jgi:CBS domain-containing protein
MLEKAKRRKIMLLRDVMSSDVEVVRSDATLQETAQRMRAHQVGSVLVRDGDQFVGILTDRDLTVRAVAEGCDPKATPVRAVMTPEVTWCFEDDDVNAAVRCMRERHIRHLAVLSRDQQVVGIVSLYALAMRTGDEMLAGTAIRWPA